MKERIEQKGLGDSAWLKVEYQTLRRLRQHPKCILFTVRTFLNSLDELPGEPLAAKALLQNLDRLQPTEFPRCEKGQGFTYLFPHGNASWIWGRGNAYVVVISFITVCSFWSPMWVCVFNTEGLSFFWVPLISKKNKVFEVFGHRWCLPLPVAETICGGQLWCRWVSLKNDASQGEHADEHVDTMLTPYPGKLQLVHSFFNWTQYDLLWSMRIYILNTIPYRLNHAEFA